MTEEILYEVESMGIPIQVIDKTNVRHLRFGNSIRQSSINKERPFKLQTKYTRDMAKVFDHYKDTKILFASTSSVKELQSPYAISKYAICRKFTKNNSWEDN